jgi:hypothetical protein
MGFVSGHDFTVCGITYSELQEVSGHDLSRAVNGSKKNAGFSP